MLNRTSKQTFEGSDTNNNRRERYGNLYDFLKNKEAAKMDEVKGVTLKESELISIKVLHG